MKVGPFVILFFASMFLGCNPEKKHAYTFYYWKTKLSLNSAEKQALQKATATSVFVRFFDIDKVGEKFEPIAVAQRDTSFTTTKRIVPVIFITNRTFVNTNDEQASFLAQNIYQLLKKKTKDFNFKTASEIQIDCDWTVATKGQYFAFLKELSRISGKNITCTLRLHQVKSRLKTGVPPVKKVYLMCYSTSSPIENNDENSILEYKTLKNYLHNLEEYPIKKMDVALPVFSWAIVTNHLGRHQLINGISSEDLNHPNFKKTSENNAEVLKDGFYFCHFLNKGFQIKTEEIEEARLDETVRFLNKNIRSFNIVYYQLDGKFLKNRTFNR